MIHLSIKQKTKQRLTKAVNVFVQFTFVVYSVGFGFLAAPLTASAAGTADDVVRPNAPKPTLEEFVTKSLAAVDNSTKTADVQLAPLAETVGNPIYAWDRTPNPSWSHGQISGYYETEDIPFQLELNGLTAGVSTNVGVRMEHKKGGIVGLEEFRHPDATTEPGLPYNTDRTPFTMSAPTTTNISGVLYKTYTFTFTPTGTTASLYWDGLIALGAHNYSGASLDVRYQASDGAKTVPIATTEFLYNTFTIEKYDTLDPIDVNETTQYHILFVNTGNAEAQNVVVTDTLPSGLSFDSVIDSDGGTVQVNGQVITITFPAVAEGTGKEIILQVVGSVAATHTNTVSVVSTFQPNPTTTTEDTTVVQNNPPFPLYCGLDIALVIDSSSSIDNTELNQMKSAYHSFVNALLPATPTTFGVVEFNTNVIDPILGLTDDATVINDRIDDAVSRDYTNWEAGLYEAGNVLNGDTRPANPNIVLFASDGNPNTIGIDGTSTNGNAPSSAAALNAAVFRANAIKADGARVIALGIGTGGNATFINNLKAISGPNVNTGDIQTSDVITTEFSTLAQDLARLTMALCGGTVNVTKRVDGQVASGWQFSAAAVNGTVTPASGATDNTGKVSFNIDDINGTATVAVTEFTQPGYALSNAACTSNGQATGVFNGTNAVTNIAVGPTDIVSCVFDNVTETGGLRVTKVVQPNGSTNPAAPSDFGFRLNANDNFVSPAAQTNAVLFEQLTPGAYTVEETGPANYHQVSSTCTDVQVAHNQTTDCTITNARNTGELIINKVDQTGAPLDVLVAVDGTEYDDTTNTGADGTHSFGQIPTDTYTVTETSPIGYTANGWTCTILGDQNIVTNGIGATLEADVLYGRTTTCTFTNTRDTGTIVVHKDVVAPDGQTDVNDTHNFTVELDGANGKTISESQTATYANVPTGTYSITELSDPNYELVSITNNGNVTVTTDQTTDVYVVNKQKYAKITVTKDVINPDGGQVADDHTFVARVTGGNNVNLSGNMSEGHNVTFNVWPGSYAIGEDADADYDLVSILPANVSLSSNQEATVDVVNKQKKAHLTIRKNVVNPDGGDTTDNTPFYVELSDGQNGWVAENASLSFDVNPGTTVVTETVTAGYTLVGYDPSDTVNLPSNGSGSLTITNKQAKATIVIHKNVLNPDGVDIADNHSFGVQLSDGQSGSVSENGATFFDVNPGTYTLTELPDPNYELVGYDASDTVTVGPAGGAHITVINKQKKAHITVYKDVRTFQGGAVSDDASFDVSWTGGANFSITESAQKELVVNPGTYNFTELANSNYTTQNPDESVTVGPNGTASITFVNWQKPGTITGYKWNDLNGNGTWGDGEPTLAGWTINLLNADKQVIATTTTNGSGMYTFSNLLPGTYWVSEAVQAGWVQTSTPTILGPLQIASNTTLSGNNFGNFQLGTVQGSKWEDVNGNGTWDNDEPGLGGWTINLWSDDEGPDTVIATTTTAGDGSYSFTGLTAGIYWLSEETQAGWTQTSSPAVLGPVSITSGDHIVNQNFGNFKNGTITGYKWNDLDGDGQWDNGEPALAGWVINLLDAQDQVMTTTTTAGNGSYAFTNLEPGTYKVAEQQQAGWMQTSQTAVYGPFVMTSDATFSGNNFGNFQLFDLTATKKLDADGSLATANDQTLKEGWTMQLWKNGNPIDVQITGVDGSVTWTNLGPGSYDVQEIFDASAYTPLTATHFSFDAQSGEQQSFTFVNFQNVTFSGAKWNDMNGNGKWDDDEPSLAGWTINLWSGCDATDLDYNKDASLSVDDAVMFTSYYQDNSTAADVNHDSSVNAQDYACADDAYSDGILTASPSAIIDSAVTDQYGNFAFTNLGPGTYYVNETQQAGWVQTSTPVVYGPITAVSGQDVDNLIFGNYQLGEITGTKYEKTDADNFILADWTIRLWKDTGEGFVQIDETTTDESGQYHFTDLLAGTYRITEVIPETTGFGWLQEQPVSGYHEIVMTSGLSSNENDFINRRLYSDLTVSKDDGLTTAQPGDTITYDVTITNNGEYKAESISAIDTLPDNVSYVSDTSGAALVQVDNVLTWDFGSRVLNPGESMTFGVTVTIDGVMPSGTTTLTNLIVVSTESTESDTTNNSDTDVTNVTAAANLNITKDVSQKAANPGNTVTYTITIENDATATAIAENVMISDDLPTGFTLASNGETTYTIAVGDLAPGASTTVSFNVVIGKNVAAGTYTNTGIGSSDNTGDVEDDADITVVIPQVLGAETSATLTIDKTVDHTSVNPRGLLLYTVTVTNTGDETATNVVVTDSLPQGFVFVADGAVTKTFALGDLAPNHSRSITYQVRVAEDAKAGTYTNLATAKADNADPVADQVNVEVRAGRVLAATGASPLDYALGILGAVLLALGISGIARFTRTRKNLPKIV